MGGDWKITANLFPYIFWGPLRSLALCFLFWGKYIKMFSQGMFFRQKALVCF